MLLLFSSLAHAHSGAVPIRGQYDWSSLPAAEPWVWWVWEFYPSVVLGCLAFVLVYEALAGPLRTRWELSPVGPSVGQRVRFHGGVALVFFSLQGPLHELSDVYLFSGHMVQHLLITLAFPPLWIRGTPDWMWNLLLRRRALRAIGSVIAHPVVAWMICTVILYLWHIPAMYEAALADHNVHIAEHLSFMFGYTLLWWPAMSPSALLPALSPGGRMAYLFLATIPMKGLGALITMSDYVLYPFYAQAARVGGLDPLTDQRLGGLIMWLPGGLVFWVTIGIIFFQHYGAETGYAVRRPAPVPEAS